MDATKSPPLPIRGGEYTAREYPDGSADLLRVPIFGELPKDARNNSKPIKRAWHLAAWKNANLLKNEGFLPPLHIDHHGEGFDPEPAGHFEIVGVGEMTYRGKKMSVMFADFLRVPPKIYKRIKRGELPYCSVEVADWDDPLINSLALLDDDCPFFMLPMVTVGDAHPARLSRAGNRRPHRLYAVARGRIIFAMTSKGATMDDPNAQPAAPAADPRADRNEKILMAVCKKLGIDPDAIDGGDEETEDGDGGMLQNDEPMPDDGADGGPAEHPEDDTDASRVFSSPAAAKMIGKMHAKLAALEAREQKREREEKIRGMVADAKKQLAGYHIDAETEQTIETFARAGANQLKAYVVSFAKFAAADPPSSYAEYDAATAGAATGAEPPEVAKFAAAGGRKAEIARGAWKQHQMLTRHGKCNTPLDRFIENAIDADAANQRAHRRA